MPANAENIWSVPVYLHSVQPDLTDAALDEAEKIIGHKLPREYVALLRVQNGGYIRYELPGQVHNCISGIGPRFPSLTQFDWADCVDQVDFPLDRLVPFDGDGHWYLCLDYREREADPPITLVDIELNQQQFIADSFAAYLARLRREVNEEFVLPGLNGIEQVKSLVKETLGLRFVPVDPRTVSHEMHRATDPGMKHEWIWLSPNTVPRGFRRKGDGHYTRIERYMTGTAERHPELPPGSWLLGVTDALRSRTTDALRSAGISVLSLRPLIPDADPG